MSPLLSIPSGVGCTYRCETVTLLQPAIFMMVNASVPGSPKARHYGVAYRVHDEFLGQFQGITHLIMLMVNRVPRKAASGDSPGNTRGDLIVAFRIFSVSGARLVKERFRFALGDFPSRTAIYPNFARIAGCR